MAFESRRSSETLAAWLPVSISRLRKVTVVKDLEIGDSPQQVTRRNAKAKENVHEASLYMFYNCPFCAARQLCRQETRHPHPRVSMSVTFAGQLHLMFMPSKLANQYYMIIAT